VDEQLNVADLGALQQGVGANNVVLGELDGVTERVI
jgi:hypothetical protein